MGEKDFKLSRVIPVVLIAGLFFGAAAFFVLHHFVGPDRAGSDVEVVEAPLKNGERNGVAKVYLKGPKRILIEEIPYVNGKKHGEMRGYDHDSGKLKLVKPYVNGLVHGELRMYYPDSGKPHVVAPYVEGEPHGTAKWFHPSGAVRLEHHWVRGKEDGRATWRDESGRVVAEGTYRNGKRWDGTFQVPVFDGLDMTGYRTRTFREGKEVEQD